MGKYFGTDGYRGKANETLRLDYAIKIGRYLGYYYGKKGHARILIGKDTRQSSSMYEMALATGLSASGATVYLLGVCPTPCVSYLIQKENFDCGIMVSASHNPYYDNGIKLFNGEGKKMDPEIEEAIEAYFESDEELEFAIEDKIGKVINFEDGLQLYISWLKEVNPLRLDGMKIVLDLANGSATTTAQECLSELGATLEVIHSEPNGININDHCGSTHPEELQEIMREGNYDVGFAFDGDADRLIAVDEDGNLINGDYILHICGKYLLKKGKLKDNAVVTTVMANLGLYKAFEKNGIYSVQTAVGDKYVFEAMEANDYKIGGEQSGHIIYKDYENTGDGLFTALQLLAVMLDEKKSLKQLGEDLFIYPQLLVNLRVKDKEAVLHDDEVNALIKEVSDELKDEGRILVRPSGTEPLLRVMVEAKSDELCHDYVYRVVDFVKEKGL
ncbi:MAG: phosphoglucosamine mutase [Traorella sp.]